MSPNLNLTESPQATNSLRRYTLQPEDEATASINNDVSDDSFTRKSKVDQGVNVHDPTVVSHEQGPLFLEHHLLLLFQGRLALGSGKVLAHKRLIPATLDGSVKVVILIKRYLNVMPDQVPWTIRLDPVILGTSNDVLDGGVDVGPGFVVGVVVEFIQLLFQLGCTGQDPLLFSGTLTSVNIVQLHGQVQVDLGLQPTILRIRDQLQVLVSRIEAVGRRIRVENPLFKLFQYRRDVQQKVLVQLDLQIRMMSIECLSLISGCTFGK